MKTNKNFLSDPVEMFPDEELMAPQEVVVEADDDSDRPPWAGGNKDANPHRPDNDGKPDHAGSKKGELYGDQIVVFRDLGTMADMDYDDGEPVLDTSDQLIVVGYDPDGLRGGDDGLFPIYFKEVGDGDYEIPPEDLPYVQEVELERANVARAPERVMEKALEAALDKIKTADAIDTDPAGRIMYSIDEGETYATIDAPLENLALYQALLSVEGDQAGAWTEELADHWPVVELQNLLGDDLTDPDWDPSSLLGAAWSKTGEITVDAMIYENTTLGINKVDRNGESPEIDYFDFSDGGGELYSYDRSVQYPTEEKEATWLRWVVDDGGTPEYLYATVNAAVFGGEEWEDLYLATNTTGDEFDWVDAGLSGVNDFAQAADDSRAVIEFMHTKLAVEVDYSEVPSEFLGDALLT